MMNDTSSDKVRNLESRVTVAGEAVGERVRNATAVAAAATGQAERIVQDATAATVAAAGQAKRVLGDAGDAAQQAWSQAGGVTEDVVDAGRRATRSVSRQIHEHPLLAVLVGVALGYVAGSLIRGGAVDQEPSPRRTRKPRRLRHKQVIKGGSAAATNHPPSTRVLSLSSKVVE
jgi:ElaB/YqjD/DUF883 family membrane-anchored ribosome-binding protein